MGAAETAIMPTIIMAHMAKVKKASAAVQGPCVVMPIAAIALSYSTDEAIWRSRWIRYAQARAVIRAMQVEIKMRSRRGSAATEAALNTLPGKRSVLPVVLPAYVIPRQAEGVNVTPGSVSEGEAIGGGMTRVLMPERFSGCGIQSLCALCGHVKERRGLNRPSHPVALEANGCRFNSEELSNETGKRGDWSAGGAARDGSNGIALLGRGTVVGKQSDRPVPFAHFLRGQAEHNKTEAIERDIAVVPALDLKSHREGA